MEKLILKDNTEIEIEPGTGISRMITYVEDYAALGDLAGKLTRENLSAVKIGAVGGIGSGSYTDMALGDPNFKITDMGGRLKVMFGLRQLMLRFASRFPRRAAHSAAGYSLHSRR